MAFFLAFPQALTHLARYVNEGSTGAPVEGGETAQEVKEWLDVLKVRKLNFDPATGVRVRLEDF